MLLFISIALASPSDLPSGECATEVEATAQRTGKEIYELHCASCHKSDGTGEVGYFPPVVNTPWVENPSALTEVLFRGVSGTIYVNDQRYASYMSPYGKELTDEEIIRLITYIQTEMNDYQNVDNWTEQNVKALRAKLQNTQAIRGQNEMEALVNKVYPQTEPN